MNLAKLPARYGKNCQDIYSVYSINSARSVADPGFQIRGAQDKFIHLIQKTYTQNLANTFTKIMQR